MIITCPSCSTRYLVDPAALGETGRMVRCAVCSHTWGETPPDDMPKRVDTAVAYYETQPIPPGSNLPALPHRHGAKDWIGWAALAVAIAAALGGAVAMQDRIVRAWPLAERLYLMVGLVEPSPGDFFELGNVKQSTFVENEHTVVVVTGEIVNISAETRPIPKVFAQIFDADRRVIKKWVVTPAGSDLAPGAIAAFSDRFVDPPYFSNLIVSLEDGG